MAISGPVHFDLDPFNRAIAMENDGNSKLFMDQYLLSAGSYSVDHFSPSTHTIDETLPNPLNRDEAPGSFSFSRGSVDSASMIESPFDDGGFTLQSFATSSPDQTPSPTSLPNEPAQIDATPSDNFPTPPPKSNSKEKLQSEKTPRKRKGRTLAMERNRLAATKSRRKSKSATDALEATCNELEEKHLHLKAQHADLVQHTLLLKSEILRHAICGDSNIEIWVTDEARSFVKQIERQ